MENLVRSKIKIDEALQRTAMKVLSDFGPSVQTAILYHLRRLEGASSDEQALSDPIRFSKALETIFSEGASIIEDNIIEAMCKTIGVDYEKTKGSFEEKIARIHDLDSNARNPRLLFKIAALEQTMILAKPVIC